MSRLSWIAGLTAAFLVGAAAPAAAAGPLGPAEVLIAGCTAGVGDAAIATDGASRGFANCTGLSSGRIWFFRDTPAAAPFREPTPYTGVVRAVAWDGQGATYVVFQRGTELRIGKRVESSAGYSAETVLSTTARFPTADVVASNGRWWAVWSEFDGVHDQLFQRHTLLGVQGRTRITTTAPTLADYSPTLAYAGGRVTMVWSRTLYATEPFRHPVADDLRIADSTGGSWLSRPFASLGDQNTEPDMTIYGGITWVTWVRDGRIVVADNAGGAFHSRTFLTLGYSPTVAVSGSHAFVAWRTSEHNDEVFLAELSGGAWTGTLLDRASPYLLRVLAQGTKARVLFQAAGSSLVIRTQL